MRTSYYYYLYTEYGNANIFFLKCTSVVLWLGFYLFFSV